MMDDEGDYVDFMVKYKDWISIRRLAIRPDTRPEEIVFHLAGVRGAMDSKSFLMLGINTAPLDALAAKLTEGKKKSYEDLGQAIASLSGPETKRAVDDACKDKRELAPIAKTYLLGKVITDLELDASINQKVMSKIFPDLKVRKPLGRTKKKVIESPQ